MEQDDKGDGRHGLLGRKGKGLWKRYGGFPEGVISGKMVDVGDLL